jgi:hypothetical protein
MKTKITLSIVAVLMALPISALRAQQNDPKTEKNDSALMADEKAAWEAYKGKQADAFKKLLASDYIGVYAEGFKTVEAEVADMAKSDVRDFTFADMKVTHPGADIALVTYKVTTHATFDGKDVSGPYNAASVYLKRGGKWLAISHTEIKAQ